MPNMSGVVVKLNDDEEEDEDDTGLLSRRGYDDSDEDLDDLRHKSGMVTKSLHNANFIKYSFIKYLFFAVYLASMIVYVTS